MSIEEKLTTIAENVELVHKAGKRAEEKLFWDTYQSQNKAIRRNYNYAFYGASWNDNNFKPKNNFIFSSANYAFHSCGITDLVAILNRERITMDFSTCTIFSYTFYGSELVTLPVINTTKGSSLANTFGQSSKLKRIEELVLKSDGSQTFTSTFTGCSALEHMIVSGTIGKNGFSVSSCTNLDKESLLSILNALQDKTGDTSGTTWTITLGSVNKSKLSDAQLEIAENKGWTVS